MERPIFDKLQQKPQISMGPVKLKPVTKQDEATKLILKQLEFINMLMKN